MDIAALGTALSAMNIQNEHAVRINRMVKDQLETQGQQVQQLIESTAPAADPSSPIGQNIDISV